MGNTTLSEAAAEVLMLAESAPRRALAPAARIVHQARRDDDARAGSVAERALGIAALHLSDTDVAARHLRRATALGTRAAAPDLAAEARLRLAAVLNLRGRPTAALREIDTALDEASGVARARGLAQRAAIVLQLGRLDEARSDLDRAVPALRAAGDVMWLKRALANRGVVQARRARFTAADSDLREALRLNRDLGLELSVAFIEQNLGWVATLRGDVPRALTQLDRAEGMLRAQGAQVGFLLEDRAALLLSTGLVAEARVVAHEAVTALERERQRIALPDVRLLLARACLLDGDVAAATTQARTAVGELVRRQRRETAMLARFLLAQCRAADPDERQHLALGPLVRRAQEIEDAGWWPESVEARLLVADLAEERGSHQRAAQQLHVVARGRFRGPAALRAAGWYAEGLLRVRAGRPRAALSALTAGLRVLDEHRAGLGTLDLRVHSGGQRVALATLGLEVAVEGGRGEQILTWAEQGRNTHLLLPPLLPPDDPALEADLADLRSVSEEIETSRRAGQDPRAAYRRQATVERRIRDRTRRRSGGGGSPSGTVRIPELAQALGESALVEYVAVAGELNALSVVGGRTRFTPLGPVDVVAGLVERLSFALHRRVRGHGDAAAVDRLLADTASRLDGLLLRPLAGLEHHPLVVVPTGRLQSLPWSLLPSLRGRSVTVAPSATSWHASAGGVPVPAAGRRVVVVAGPGLPGARAEAAAVAAAHGTAPLPEDAGVDRVTVALAGADIGHLAAHGTVDSHHPLLSSVRLNDGPLTGYDLDRLRPAPRLVVLASCDGGRHAVRVGDELLGLTATLLARGTRVVVAPVAPVVDSETAALMAAFHAALLTGRPAAEALAAAQLESAGGAPSTAGFVCIGGEFSLATDVARLD